MMRAARNAAFTAVGALASLALVYAPMAAADRGEDIFKRALDYTVQIRTIVQLPFDGDRKGTSTGSGFVVDAERGWVMTNAHVVSRSPALIQASFKDKEYTPAKKIYVDPFLDLAVIQVGDKERPARLVQGDLACGDRPPVGHPVGAFGHPWGLKYTGTRGIISGVTNRYETEMLQTDAPINGGNSGGPLISLESGKIVGINTAALAPSSAQNTNFALAMQYACRVVQLLREGKDPSPPVPGLVYFRDVDDRNELKVAKNYLGADKLAVQTGDIIKSVAGERSPIGTGGDPNASLANDTQLAHVLRGRLNDFTLNVLRDGKEVSIRGSWPAAPSVQAQRGLHFSGMLLGIREYVDLKESGFGRVFIVHMESASIGESLGLELRQSIESIDGVPIQSLDEAHAKLKQAMDEKRRAKLVLKRIVGRGAGLFGYVERQLPVRGLAWLEDKGGAREAE